MFLRAVCASCLSQHALRRPRWGARAGLAAALALSAPAVPAAEPPPVRTGLWDVRLLTTFERRGAPAGAAEAPRARNYRICIGAERARSPMLPRRLPARAELLFDRQSVSFTHTEAAPAGATRQLEFNYRRLDAGTFEGSFDQTTAAQVTRMQYFARHLAADCGALPPSAPSPGGEP